MLHSPVTAVPSIAEASLLVDGQGRIVAADRIAREWMAAGDSDSPSLERMFPGTAVMDALTRIMQEDNEVAFDAAVCRIDSAETRVRLRLQRLDGANGPLALVTVVRNEEIATLDALTGLPDRRAIADRVAAWRQSNAAAALPFAVLFLDMDDFKRINDEHGHAMGDRVLEAFAQRLAPSVRDGDLVARYGGDEFVILLKNGATVDEAEPVVARLVDCGADLLELAGRRLHVHATIGVAVSEDSARPIEELIAAADRDMYARKRRRLK